MEERFECRYERDEREYCDRGELGNVSVESYAVCDGRVAGLVDGLEELSPVMVMEEGCDCWEKYGEVRHNDGGNYHSRVRVYEITPCVYLAVYGDTREAFSMDDYKYIVVWVDGRAVGMIVCKAQDCFQLLKREELDEFVEGYAQEGYEVYRVS